jgi:hypothetical protein
MRRRCRAAAPPLITSSRRNRCPATYSLYDEMTVRLYLKPRWARTAGPPVGRACAVSHDLPRGTLAVHPKAARLWLDRRDRQGSR